MGSTAFPAWFPGGRPAGHCPCCPRQSHGRWVGFAVSCCFMVRDKIRISQNWELSVKEHVYENQALLILELKSIARYPFLGETGSWAVLSWDSISAAVLPAFLMSVFLTLPQHAVFCPVQSEFCPVQSEFCPCLASSVWVGSRDRSHTPGPLLYLVTVGHIYLAIVSHSLFGLHCWA
jgi:hypothetical protein